MPRLNSILVSKRGRPCLPLYVIFLAPLLSHAKLSGTSSVNAGEIEGWGNKKSAYETCMGGGTTFQSGNQTIKINIPESQEGDFANARQSALNGDSSELDSMCKDMAGIFKGAGPCKRQKCTKWGTQVGAALVGNLAGAAFQQVGAPQRAEAVTTNKLSGPLGRDNASLIGMTAGYQTAGFTNNIQTREEGQKGNGVRGIGIAGDAITNVSCCAGSLGLNGDCCKNAAMNAYQGYFTIQSLNANSDSINQSKTTLSELTAGSQSLGDTSSLATLTERERNLMNEAFCAAHPSPDCNVFKDASELELNQFMDKYASLPGGFPKGSDWSSIVSTLEAESASTSASDNQTLPELSKEEFLSMVEETVASNRAALSKTLAGLSTSETPSTEPAKEESETPSENSWANQPGTIQSVSLGAGDSGGGADSLTQNQGAGDMDLEALQALMNQFLNPDQKKEEAERNIASLGGRTANGQLLPGHTANENLFEIATYRYRHSPRAKESFRWGFFWLSKSNPSHQKITH